MAYVVAGGMPMPLMQSSSDVKQADCPIPLTLRCDRTAADAVSLVQSCKENAADDQRAMSVENSSK